MKLFFSLMLLAILGVTTWASQQQSVMDGFDYLIQNRWGVATFFDTYFGFITLYLWIAYKESTWPKRALWFVLVMALGSIAFSFYILRELFRLPKGASFESLLLRSK